jgi:hypothetical protein
MEYQCLIAQDDELIEGDPAGRPVGQVRLDAVDSLGDLGDSGGGVGGHVMTVTWVRHPHYPNLLGWA